MSLSLVQVAGDRSRRLDPGCDEADEAGTTRGKDCRKARCTYEPFQHEFTFEAANTMRSPSE